MLKCVLRCLMKSQARFSAQHSKCNRNKMSGQNRDAHGLKIQEVLGPFSREGSYSLGFVKGMGQ